MTDPFYAYRPVLDLLGKSEGTDKGRGYNETLGYGAYTGGKRDLVTMTLAQIDELQRAMLAHPANSFNSSAMGRYQIVRKTRIEIEGRLKLSRTMLFDEAMQDRMACFLLGRRGIDKWQAGLISNDGMINALAYEWASLPNANGRGMYNGQRASVSVGEVREALEEVRSRRKRGAAAQAPSNTGATPSGPKIDLTPSPIKRGGWWVAIQALFGAIFGGRSK